MSDHTDYSSLTVRKLQRASILLLLGLIATLWCTRTVAQAGTEQITKQLDLIDHPAAGAPIFVNAADTEKAIDGCIVPGQKTEFDTPVTALERATKAQCRFAGVTTFKARGDSLLGDTLHYDAENETANWELPLIPGSGLLYGQVASPFDPLDEKDQKSLSTDERLEINALKKKGFLLVPLYGGEDRSRTYEATNGFGAKKQVTEVRGDRWSIAVDSGNSDTLSPRMRIATAKIARAKAAELFPFLQMKLYWVAHRPCSQCLFGTFGRTGNYGPTFNDPNDVELKQHIFFAAFVAVRFVDSRDGSTVAVSTGGR